MTVKNKIFIIAALLFLIASLSIGALIINGSDKNKDYDYGIFLRRGGQIWTSI